MQYCSSIFYLEIKAKNYFYANRCEKYRQNEFAWLFFLKYINITPKNVSCSLSPKKFFCPIIWENFFVIPTWNLFKLLLLCCFSYTMCFICKFINHMLWSYSLKVKIFESKMRFNNSCSFHSGSENILLSWDVIWLCYSVQVIQIAEKQKKNNMLTVNIANKDHQN